LVSLGLPIETEHVPVGIGDQVDRSQAHLVLHPVAVETQVGQMVDPSLESLGTGGSDIGTADT